MTPETDNRERALLELARALPREVVPPARVWEAIQAEATSAARAAPGPAPAPLRFWQRPGMLAAAALLLVAGSSAVTASLVLRANRGAGVAMPGVARIGDATSPFAEFAARENDYLHQVNTLVAVVEDESNGLSPETIATIRVNLLVIDAAILEVRRALADDPANRRLVEMLASTYEKKVDLLRRTSAMARS